MKRKRLLGLVIAFGLTVILTTASAVTLFVSTPNGKSVNMRIGAGKSNKVLTTVPNGFAVTTEDTANNSGWLLCTYDGYRGYISRKYLSTVPGTIYGFAVNCYAVTVKPSRAGGYVNLRAKPTKASKSIGQYKKGEELFVLRSNGTWSQIYDPNSCDYGFMMSRFLVYKNSLNMNELIACLAESAADIPAIIPTKYDETSMILPYPGEDYANFFPTYPEE